MTCLILIGRTTTTTNEGIMKGMSLDILTSFKVQIGPWDNWFTTKWVFIQSSYPWERERERERFYGQEEIDCGQWDGDHPNEREREREREYGFSWWLGLSGNVYIYTTCASTRRVFWSWVGWALPSLQFFDTVFQYLKGLGDYGMTWWCLLFFSCSI